MLSNGFLVSLLLTAWPSAQAQPAKQTVLVSAIFLASPMKLGVAANGGVSSWQRETVAEE